MSSEERDAGPRGADFMGRYEILEVLGRGGMGEVARAYDRELRRHVAIKRLVARRDHDGDARKQRLLREARAVAQLNHPNVVSIYDVGESDGVGFVVMELVEGGALHDRTRAGKSWTIADAVRWLVDAASGLARAHESGLVHRDIKPPNLLVSREGRIKVADFGIVKELEGRGDATIDSLAVPLTEDGHVVGTPRYMAPEQLRGEAVDGRTDQYAWAVVAYELFGGVHPYDSQLSPATPIQIAKGAFQPSPLVLRMPSLPSALEAVVLRALSAEPSARYDSMRDALEALEEAAKGHDLEALVVSRASAPRAGGTSPNTLANQPTMEASKTAPEVPRAPAGTTETMGDLLGPSPSDPTMDVVGAMRAPTVPEATRKGEPRRRGIVFGAAVVGTVMIALAAVSLRGGQGARPAGGSPSTTASADAAPPPGLSRAIATPCGADNDVDAVALVGDTLLVGGRFSAIGCPTGSGAILDLAKGEAKAGVSASRIDGVVTAAIADPARPGGFYLGGEFSHAGGRATGALVRLAPDGSVDADFDPHVDGKVEALAVAGTSLYVAGRFKNAGGAEREGLAALDTTTGRALPAFASFDGRGIDALAVAAGKLYAGGYFDELGDVKRKNLAALDASTGKILAWAPRVDGAVRRLVVGGGKLFVVGRRLSTGFRTVNGQARSAVAAFDTATGALTPFDPKADSAPDALVVKGDVVYVSGAFDHIGGAARDGLAALDAKTGRALPFTSKSKVRGMFVDALAITDDALYLGGSFQSVGKVTRLRGAALDLATGELTPFDPRFTGDIATLAISGSSLFAGGELAAAGAELRPHLVALDRSSGRPTSLDFGVDHDVRALIPRPAERELVVAGAFTSIGGKPRGAIAKLALGTSDVLDWDAKVAGGTIDVAAVGPDGTVYIAGRFETVGGEPREGLAALDGHTGAPLAFRAKIGGDRASVTAMALSGNTLYIAGDFVEVNGTKRKGLAALDGRTGAVLPFSADTSDGVAALLATPDALFVAGKFEKVDGMPRASLAWLDLGGKLNEVRVDTPVSGSCYALALAGSTLLGGCTTPQSGIVAFDLSTKAHTPLAVEVERGARLRAVVVDGQVVYAGGSLRRAGGLARDNLFAFDRITGRVY
ncbi:MAG: protein kinase [Deltaproteobacteria bacterium]|nr:protein kinase [Deltaproteobacteria bacterium]